MAGENTNSMGPSSGGGASGDRSGGGERGGRGGGRGGRRDDKGARRGMFRRRRVCKFCVEKIDVISYKDVKLLAGFIPERGKIQPRRLSGTCAAHQRKLQTAISRARQLALIPYITD
jgi:small subunit ribosomal protein S18